MDQVTQQNAALVEEAAAAAQSMQEQADSLVAAVSVFKLEAHAPTLLLERGTQNRRAIADN
jgi:methyl-accepting chemotaxis protein